MRVESHLLFLYDLRNTDYTGVEIIKRSLVIYIVIGTIFLGLIVLFLGLGKNLVPIAGYALPAHSTIIIAPPTSTSHAVLAEWLQNLQKPLSMLFLQIIIILAASKLMGSLATKIGQPSVIGEIVAGIALGPSLFGLLFPAGYGFLFPKESLVNLQFLSQFGLLFFMFIVGMELDLTKLKNKAYNAIVVSHASIVVPYFLGVVLSYFIFERLAPAGTSFIAFALFMGIAMSITAFPVLARILHERNLTKSSLGTLALTCAAADDITAWCMLAAVIAIIKTGGMATAWVMIAMAIIFVLVMFYLVRPALLHFSKREDGKSKFRKSTIAMAFLTLLGSAYVAELIGIHALFGGFIAGVIMPHTIRFKELMTEKVEDVSVLVLLPIFFALTGIRTEIGLLNSCYLWAICAITILLAILGKFGGASVASRMVGSNWKDALSIGALMNTRGLMELIVLNIGYELGILSPQIFAIMVIMALMTTFMTGPSLNLINRFSARLS